MTNLPPFICAVPKGRILKEALPLLQAGGITPEEEFFDESSRKLRFNAVKEGFSFIRVRSFDVATFVAFGAAQIGIAGSDVLEEFDFSELYAPLDLNIGKCRLSLARRKDADLPSLDRLSHVRVATKYPNITQRWFAQKGIQAECIKLNGAMELAPTLGLCDYIIDLVSTGNTLRANGLEEVETLLDVSSRLIVNRTAFKTRSQEIQLLTTAFREALDGQQAA